MKIGITYDTPETYKLDSGNKFICDLCDVDCINHLVHTLVTNGHEVIKMNGIKELFDNRQNNFDIIINSSEGYVSRNREALTPSILEALGFHYVGADAQISSITLNKILMSDIASFLGIKCPPQIVLNRNNYKEYLNSNKELPFYPMILKPNLGGNSSGTFVCQNNAEALYYAESILTALPNEQIICQQFIFGTEITVPVFGNDDNIEIFDIIGFKEQQNGKFWINTEQKVFGGVTETSIQLAEPIKAKVLSTCQKLYKYLQFRDYTRFDFRIDGKNIYFLEANAFPYLGEDGAMYESFKRNKYSYYDFILYLIETAQKRKAIQ